jgi:hypothetical protein
LGGQGREVDLLEKEKVSAQIEGDIAIETSY